MLKEQLRSDRYILKYDISFIHVTFDVNLVKDTFSRSDVSFYNVCNHDNRHDFRDAWRENEYKRRGWRGGLAENLLTQTRSLTGGHAERTEAAVRVRGRGWRRGWCVAPKARRWTPSAQNSVSRGQMRGPQAITTRHPAEERRRCAVTSRPVC